MMMEILFGFRRRYICHFAASLFAFFVVVPVVFMLLDRGRVLDIHHITVTSLSRESATIEWSVTELRPCDGDLNRTITILPPGATSAITVSFATEKTVFHTGKRERKTFRKIIPLPNIAGQATMFSYVRRWCNPLQEYIWPIRETIGPINFTIP